MEREKKLTRDSKAEMENAEWLARREAEIDGHYSMAHVDKTHVDPSRIPHGRQYYWGRQSCRGHQDDARMAYLARRGFTAVPAENHPELCVGKEMGGNFGRNYIDNEGLVLMERPEKYLKIELEQIAKHNLMIESEMPGKDNFLGEPTIPVRFMADPRSTRGPSSF